MAISLHVYAQLDDWVLCRIYKKTGKESPTETLLTLTAADYGHDDLSGGGGGGMPMFEIPGMPGAQMGAISIGDIFGKMGGRTKTRRLTVEGSHELLVNEESDKLLDSDQLVLEAINAVENNGIVFLDEIDKICVRDGRSRRTGAASSSGS